MGGASVLHLPAWGRKTRVGARVVACGVASSVLFASCTSERVTQVSVSAVEVIPPTVNAIEGDRIPLQAAVQDEHGKPLELAAVVWTSSDPEVASVDADGIVEARAPGSAEVTATFQDAVGRAWVTVAAGPSIAVSRSSVSMFAGDGGSPPEPEIVSVFNGGNGTIGSLRATVEYPQGADAGWLDAVLASSSAPTSLTLMADTQPGGPGVYRAQVVIASDDAAITPQTISVELSVAGFTVTETGSGTTVTEAESTDRFEVVLSSRPRSNVVFSVTISDVGEATLSHASLTFAPSNWSEPRNVTVKGMDDAVDDGNQTSTVTVSVDDAASDETFDDLPDKSVVVTTIDNDDAPPPPPPPPTATRLTFTQEPPTIQPLLSTFTVRVAAADETGNIISGYTGTVTIRIANDASLLGGARLGGTTSVNAVNGVATFSGVRVDQLGVGYTLGASATGLTGATSASFSVVF